MERATLDIQELEGWHGKVSVRELKPITTSKEDRSGPLYMYKNVTRKSWLSSAVCKVGRQESGGNRTNSLSDGLISPV